MPKKKVLKKCDLIISIRNKVFRIVPHEKDLPEKTAFDDAVEAVAKLNSYGEKYANEKELYDALENGTYKGGWFIPSRLILLLMQENKDKTYDNEWYCSCTEYRDYPVYVWNVRFSDGLGDWIHRGLDRSSVRPCLAQELDI
jgi:hypothetical protein